MFDESKDIHTIGIVCELGQFGAGIAWEAPARSL
jgi:hypothetical protein